VQRVEQGPCTARASGQSVGQSTLLTRSLHAEPRVFEAPVGVDRILHPSAAFGYPIGLPYPCHHVSKNVLCVGATTLRDDVTDENARDLEVGAVCIEIDNVMSDTSA